MAEMRDTVPNRVSFVLKTFKVEVVSRSALFVGGAVLMTLSELHVLQLTLTAAYCRPAAGARTAGESGLEGRSRKRKVGVGVGRPFSLFTFGFRVRRKRRRFHSQQP